MFEIGDRVTFERDGREYEMIETFDADMYGDRMVRVIALDDSYGYSEELVDESELEFA